MYACIYHAHVIQSGNVTPIHPPTHTHSNTHHNSCLSADTMGLSSWSSSLFGALFDLINYNSIGYNTP